MSLSIFCLAIDERLLRDPLRSFQDELKFDFSGDLIKDVDAGH